MSAIIWFVVIKWLICVLWQYSYKSDLLFLLLFSSSSPTSWRVCCILRHRMTPYGTLVIRNTEKKDGGVYGCLASNQAGTDAMTSILTYIGEWHSA